MGKMKLENIELKLCLKKCKREKECLKTCKDDILEDLKHLYEELGRDYFEKSRKLRNEDFTYLVLSW